ncbi:MAG: class I SAM-dependent methyltransferase [Coriobacteriia bacterium]|nr:class I SAM-dependent methyltransferase [Coriobacteriia bacterium]
MTTTPPRNEAVYIHDVADHPLVDPQILLPHVIDRIRPESVVDVGCGIGTFLHVCKDLGVSQVLGVDGEWVDRDLLFGHISPHEFRSVDLATDMPLELPRHDLAICLEVAEHLDGSCAASLVQSLVAASDCVLFSAAIPGQGGQHHVNEQWPEYWAALFAAHEYVMADVVRPLVWDEPRISYWYRQNCFLAVRSDKQEILKQFPTWSDVSTGVLSLVHPELLQDKVDAHGSWEERVFSGGLKTRSYLYLMARSVLRRITERAG